MKDALLYLLLFITCGSFSQQLEVEGSYQGKTIFIQNPLIDDSTFCIEKIQLNSVEIELVQSIVFELDPASFNLAVGDSVSILITHKINCKPKILNPYPPIGISTFEIVDIQATNEGKLTWKTKNETCKMVYIIEQYRWNKWVKIGEVEGNGSITENTYSFDVIPNSGENLVRVKQVDYTGKPRISESARFHSEKEPVKITNTDKKKKSVSLSTDTLFELYDKSGNLVKRGYGNQIDCTGLPGKIYYLNYDNTTSVIHFQKTHPGRKEHAS